MCQGVAVCVEFFFSVLVLRRLIHRLLSEHEFKIRVTLVQRALSVKA